MKRVCDVCGATTKIRAFRYWDGRCSSCRAPLIESLKRQHPIPTRDEVADYLAYMDDLNAIRQHRITSLRVAIVLVILFIVLVIGFSVGEVSARFTVIMVVAMGVTFGIAGGSVYRVRCPRCKRRFAYRRVLGVEVQAREVDKCGHCGLRALSQGDLQRARAFYLDGNETADEEPRDSSPMNM